MTGIRSSCRLLVMGSWFLLLVGEVASWFVSFSWLRSERLRSINGYRRIAGENLTNWGGVTCDGQASRPGGSRNIFLGASCYMNLTSFPVPFPQAREKPGKSAGQNRSTSWHNMINWWAPRGLKWKRQQKLRESDAYVNKKGKLSLQSTTTNPKSGL